MPLPAVFLAAGPVLARLGASAGAAAGRAGAAAGARVGASVAESSSGSMMSRAMNYSAMMPHSNNEPRRANFNVGQMGGGQEAGAQDFQQPTVV